MVEPGEKYALDITVKPPWPSGRVRLSTGVPEQPEDEVDFRVRWERLTFRCEPRKVPRVRTERFQVKATPEWRGEQPAGSIQSVESSTPGVRAHIEEARGEAYVIVEIDPECPAPYSSFYVIKVRTDDSGAREVTLPIEFAF